MPIPLVVWGVAIGATALVGAVKGGKGIGQMKEAKELAGRARQRHENALERLHDRRAIVAESVRLYGLLLAELNDTTLNDARRLLEKLQKKHKARNIALPESAQVEAGSLSDYQQKVLDPPADLAGALSAATAGAAAGSSAFGLVGVLGTASTGTAIGTLSGAAATNATLAWLGGGSLAAGGGGMAAGTLVLGGVVAGPVLAVAGLVLASKGEKAKTEARAYDAKANVAVEKLRAIGAFLEQVKRRAEELEGVARSLDVRAREALGRVDPDSFDIDNPSDVQKLAQALQLVKALSDLMQTPLIAQNGELTEESGTLLVNSRQLALEQR